MYVCMSGNTGLHTNVSQISIVLFYISYNSYDFAFEYLNLFYKIVVVVVVNEQKKSKSIGSLSVNGGCQRFHLTFSHLKEKVNEGLR